MRAVLLPRLTSVAAAKLLEVGCDPVVSKAQLEALEAPFSFGASGGERNDDAAIEIGLGLRRIAQQSGFPDSISRESRVSFDQQASVFLATLPALRSGEAFRDDVWSFVGTVLAPDVARWRYPGAGNERFEGGVRNTFQRLWIRGSTLDRGALHVDRWGLVNALTEDAAVQIFERPAVGGNRTLAFALAEGWARAAKNLGREAMEPVMRSAVKVIRLKNEIVDLASLPRPDIDSAIDAAFASAEVVVRASKDKSGS